MSAPVLKHQATACSRSNEIPSTILWAIAAAATVWSLSYTARTNTDLWFHLAAGRAIVTERSVPETDSWAYSAPGLQWHNHEWLTDVLLRLWEQAFGTEALVYWMWTCRCATFLLLFVLVRRLSGSDSFSYLVTTLSAAMAAPFVEIRPDLVSQLLFVVAIPLALLRRTPWWGLPMLMALWINLHGGAIFGLMAIGVALAARWLEREHEDRRAERRRKALLLGLFGSCVVACLINPFGVRALSFPLRMVGESTVSRQFLTEWQSPLSGRGLPAPLLASGVLLAAAASILLARQIFRRDGQTLGFWGITMLTLAMALQSSRFVPLFALALAPLLGQAWATLSRARIGRTARSQVRLDRSSRRVWWSYAAGFMAIAIACMRLSRYSPSPETFNALVKLDWMPVECLNFVEANQFAGNVFSDFIWAGYVEYRTGGRMKVFLDPRQETVFPDAVQRRYLRVLGQASDWLGIIEGSGTQYVLWPPANHGGAALLSGLLQTGRWRKLYDDRRSTLLVRVDALPARPLRSTAPSSVRSWALAASAQRSGDLAVAEWHLTQAVRQRPVLVDLCRDLAILQARRADAAAMRATADHCDRIFPDPPQWRERLENLLSQLLAQHRQHTL